MNESDKVEFSQYLKGTLEVYGVTPTKDATGIWWNSLKSYPIDDIRNALSEHVTDGSSGKFAPKPADIIGRLQIVDGHPKPEEAWAMVAQSLTDEAITLVWTQPMAEAFGIALGLADDQIAARMAFLETYKTKLSQARLDRIPAKWTPSIGSDKTMRDGALREAVRLGRLSAPHVAGLLPGVSVESLAALAPPAGTGVARVR